MSNVPYVVCAQSGHQASGTSLALVLPQTPATDDVIISWCMFVDGTTAPNVPTNHSDLLGAQISSGASLRMRVSERRVSGDTATVTWSWSGARFAQGGAFLVRNVPNSGAIHDQANSNTGTSTSPSGSTLTPTETNTLGITIWANINAVAFGRPGGWSFVTDSINTRDATQGTPGMSSFYPGTAATGAINSTLASSQDWGVAHFNLRGSGAPLGTDVARGELYGGQPRTRPMPPTISPVSWCALGKELAAVATAAPSAVAITANRAYYYPFVVTELYVVRKAFAYVSSAEADAFELAIYDEAGRRIVTTGAQVIPIDAALIDFDLPETIITPGLYYAALGVAAATPQFFTFVAGAAELHKIWGVASQASAYPLPATFTQADMDVTGLPWFGISCKRLVA